MLNWWFRKKRLAPSEILGHRIARVLQTPFETLNDVSVCQVYVLLETGTLFELAWPADPSSDGIHAAPVRLGRLHDVDFGCQETCSGDVILDVLVSDYWPTIGLRLSSGRFLFCDAPTPAIFRAFLSKVGDVYEESDARSYWTGWQPGN